MKLTARGRCSARFSLYRLSGPVEDMDVQMVIWDIDAVLGEALAQSLVEVIARIPVIGDGCPAADSVFNGAVTVGGEENIGRDGLKMKHGSNIELMRATRNDMA